MEFIHFLQGLLGSCKRNVANKYGLTFFNVARDFWGFRVFGRRIFGWRFVLLVFVFSFLVLQLLTFFQLLKKLGLRKTPIDGNHTAAYFLRVNFFDGLVKVRKWKSLLTAKQRVQLHLVE